MKRYLAWLGLLLLPGVASASVIFSDDFNDGVLDATAWDVLSGGAFIQETGGVLSLDGASTYRRVQTDATFSPSGAPVIASARINFDGDYQKFGFAVNSVTSPGLYGLPVTGFYFDTLNRYDSTGGMVDTVYALAWEVTSGGTVNLLKQAVSVPWGEFHEFSIAWSPTLTEFIVDGVLVASVTHGFTGSVPLGLWNDRSGTMQVDWVTVSRGAVPVSAPMGGWLMLWLAALWVWRRPTARR